MFCKKSSSYNSSENKVMKSFLNVNIVINVFAYKNTLLTHQRALKIGLVQHQSIYSGENPFKCDLCDKYFARKYCLLFIREPTVMKGILNVIRENTVVRCLLNAISLINVFPIFFSYDSSENT